ncbi:CASP8-associated protein 2 isoform X2 [Hyla sarda]|uniref:CASP8-associated protein 2 isoform X2 n=1 Tax=Hyla sarda TaxID=327740 RepID=UPI0024C42F84|nr:CASP8-associated protein 2 isoform X2 [Hyla sarda]
MDRHKMSINKENFDEDMMDFQDLYASPAKSDASSVDIYDGLDMVTLPEQAAEKSSPSRNCLDLYEEILTEEGTAKEASFNDLSAEYEKCQRQMKQLIAKLKEMQSMNSSLQNENQCLKKNISALIKTARVEITRKEEEINQLNQRLGAPGRNHSFIPNPLPLLSINKSKSNTDDLSKNRRNTERVPKKDMNLQSKDINRYSKNLCDKEKTCMENSQTCTSTNLIAKKCKESTVHCLQAQVLEPLCLELNKNKKEKVLESQNKDTERNRTKEKSKSNFANLVNSDVKEKACQSLVKCGKNESSQENRNSQSEVGRETENRKYHSGSNKEKTQLKELDYSKEKQVKKYDTSPHRRESRTYGKEKNAESMHRTAEKNEEPRRSKRTHFSTPKDDGSHKLLELSDAKKSTDSGRREKRSSEYSESKHGNKESKPSKSENSTRNKPTHEHKTERSDCDRREKKRSRDEQDRSRHDRKDKEQPGKEKDIIKSSSKEKGLHSKESDKSKKSEKTKEVVGNQKDFKLSFMETLNLTLSPAKKTSDDTLVLSHASSMKGKVEGNVAEGSSQLCVIENNTDTLHPLNTDLRHSEFASVDDVTTKALTIEDSRLVSHPEPVADTTVGLNEEPPKSSVDESSELLTKLTVENKQVVCTDLDKVSLEELDTHSLADGSDFIDLDSFIEIDRCSGSPTSETPNVSITAEPIQDDGRITEQSEDADNKAIPLKSNVTEIPKELLPETDTKTTCLLVSEELNKENCHPDNQSNFGCKVATPDEVEEGEILSEDEQICKQSVQPTSIPSQLVSDQVTSVTKSPSGKDDELLPLSKPDTQILPTEKSVSKKSKIDTQPKASACPTSKGRKLSADSCLDGILKIVIPSNVQDILQMLRIIRKHIRKKYMKFKIQFSLTQFHRVLEVAALCFITLIRSLDWNTLCSSPERLQKKLCRHIETRLKKLKKNGIVDRIFEQHLIDMKKRLWKFVEEQLDSLFDILKAVMMKLCDKIEGEKNTVACISTQKSDPVKHSQNDKSKCKDKERSPSKPISCLRRLAFQSETRKSKMKPQNDNKAMQKQLVKEITGIGLNSKNVDIPSSNFNPTPKQPHLSPVKTSMSNEQCSKSQQNSSGLSFNLVSDDHMGDIFKSLLHNPDNLSLNMPESIWLLGTPEKTVSFSQKFDGVDSLSDNKTPSKASFPWFSVSPPHVQTFPCIETVLNPDVFDESCLLEIPTSASSSKSLSGSDDRLKSFSSILMEDLAVSLTVPSPLKSDSHLSFLRPVCDAESISEVDVKCCEGSVLDEEDATEQDIHLTLDSDNSSIGSLEDTGEAGSFQYHPSEPMQAVIMEKSNDHFIVKIRRAVSSSSPVSDCSPEGTGNAASKSVNAEEGRKLNLDSSLDTQSEAQNICILLHPDHKDLTSFTESLVINSKSPEEAQLTVQENKSVFKLPPSREIPAELKLPADIVEHAHVDCEQNVTHYIEETCSPVPAADILPMKTFDVNTVNLNSKKRKSVEEKPLAKRKKISPDKDKGTKYNKTEHLQLENPNKKKHKRTVSDGAIDFHSSRVSPTSLSAKNVIKKKGEVVVSWTRDEDRAILMECQKLGPSKKTFLFLSSSMNKYPHQVEERFRQLMKLFKKSRNSSS